MPKVDPHNPADKSWLTKSMKHTASNYKERFYSINCWRFYYMTVHDYIDALFYLETGVYHIEWVKSWRGNHLKAYGLLNKDHNQEFTLSLLLNKEGARTCTIDGPSLTKFEQADLIDSFQSSLTKFFGLNPVLEVDRVRSSSDTTYWRAKYRRKLPSEFYEKASQVKVLVEERRQKEAKKKPFPSLTDGGGGSLENLDGGSYSQLLEGAENTPGQIYLYALLLPGKKLAVALSELGDTLKYRFPKADGWKIIWLSKLYEYPKPPSREQRRLERKPAEVAIKSLLKELASYRIGYSNSIKLIGRPHLEQLLNELNPEGFRDAQERQIPDELSN